MNCQYTHVLEYMDNRIANITLMYYM